MNMVQSAALVFSYYEHQLEFSLPSQCPFLQSAFCWCGLSFACRGLRILMRLLCNKRVCTWRLLTAQRLQTAYVQKDRHRME